MHDIITIGTATRDVFLKSPKFKHVSDPEQVEDLGFKDEAECFALGTKIDLNDIDMAVGGGGTNTAMTFAKQGFKTKTLIKVGKDSVGDEIVDYLRDNDITVKDVKDSKKHTGYSTVLLMPGAERTILVYRGAAEKFKKREVGIRSLKSHWVYISPGEIPFTTMEWMLKNFKRRKKEVKIAMNPSNKYVNRGAKKLKTILNKLDVVIMNWREAETLLGDDYGDDDKILRDLNKVTDGIIAVTKGRDGSIVTDGRHNYKAGIYEEKEMVDRTGAGDAFGSGFVSGLMRENDIGYALKLGSANATSVVEEIGAHAGIMKKSNFQRKSQFEYLDLDIEPII